MFTRISVSPRTLLTAASLLLMGGATLSAAPQAHADNIADLFNTGVDSSRNPLNVGDMDPHYTQNSGDPDTPNTFVTTYTGYPPDPTGSSNYITLEQGDGSGLNGGNWIIPFSTTFTLPANADLSTVSISGAWSTDNAGDDILINGNSTGLTSPDFSSFTPFTLPGGFFHVGTNTLDFLLENDGAPGAIDVYFTDASFSTSAGPPATPEPGSLALLVGLSGTGALFTLRRRRKHTK